MIKNKKTFYIHFFITFIISLAYALPLYIQSSFLEQFSGIKYVGIYITCATLLTLASIIIFPQFIKKYSNYRVMLFVLLLYIIDTFLLVFARNPLTVLLFFALHYASITLLGINLDVLLEDISSSKHIGKTRTLHLTVVNTAVLLGPLLMGKIVGAENRYALPYAISSFLIIAVFFTLLIFRKNLSDRVRYRRRHFIELIDNLKKNSNLMKVFGLSFILRFFYAIMVIYTPIYLHQYIGFSWGTIGIIFTFMLTPFVFLEFPAGNLADKFFGEKELMVLGIALMSAFTFVIFLMHTRNAVMWALVLFLTRVGAALLESMHEVYFFKTVKKEDIDLINLFRDTNQAGWLIGSVIAVVILKLYPIQYLFLFLAFAVFLSLYPALTLKDTK